MKPIQIPITGNRVLDRLPNSIDVEIFEALQAFYEAFNSRNLLGVKANWLQHHLIAMDNPLGGIKRGIEEIAAVYERLFSGEAKVYVEFYDYTIIPQKGGFCAIGRERGSVQLKDQRLDLKIRTSRWYSYEHNRYMQIHHHGSIEDPALLLAYQNLFHS